MSAFAASESCVDAPLVTAVLVCWNHERFVRLAVLSALQQTYPNIELIVFDNGSTDGSRQELEKLHKEHRFTLVLQENVGLVAALNRALAMAHGEFFAVLSTDDIWLPDKTAIQVRFMMANPEVPLVSGQIEAIDASGRPTGMVMANRPGEATFKDLMSLGNFVHGPTVMCRTQALRSLGGYDSSKRIEDYPLVLKLTYAGQRVTVLPDVLTYYRRHGGNWSTGIEPELYEVGREYRHVPEYRDFYRLHFPLSFWRLVKDGRKSEALRMLVSEPVPWTWSNVGRGMTRILIPYFLVRFYRRMRRAGNAPSLPGSER